MSCSDYILYHELRCSTKRRDEYIVRFEKPLLRFGAIVCRPRGAAASVSSLVSPRPAPREVIRHFTRTICPVQQYHACSPIALTPSPTGIGSFVGLHAPGIL